VESSTTGTSELENNGQARYPSGPQQFVSNAIDAMPRGRIGKLHVIPFGGSGSIPDRVSLLSRVFHHDPSHSAFFFE
jgi:hypothetical protein